METKRWALRVATGLTVLASSVAFAAAGGNGGAGGGAGNGGGHAGLGAAAGGKAGGVSGSHMSGKGMTNTNGFEAGDRDKGLARAADRSATQAEREGVKPGHSHTHTHKASNTHHHRVSTPVTETVGS